MGGIRFRFAFITLLCRLFCPVNVSNCICSHFTVVTIENIRCSSISTRRRFSFSMLKLNSRHLVGSIFFLLDNIFTLENQRHKQFRFVVNVFFFCLAQIRSNFLHYVCSHKPIHCGQNAVCCALLLL